MPKQIDLSPMSSLVTIIESTDPAVRDQCLDSVCQDLDLPALLTECASLEKLRRTSTNLYERVRALFFLYSIHRFHIPTRLDSASEQSGIPFHGYEHLLNRRFEEGINSFLEVQKTAGASDGLSSALSASYHQLAFQTLANQVRRSVRNVKGNQWMFRMGHHSNHPLRIRPELLQPGSDGTYPILCERTPVRMDLSHCGWSDIFFLGMDYPEGARVLNISVDLGVHGRDQQPRPPVEAYFRIIEEPIIRLTSVDLGATVDISDLSEVFDFAKDYLGLLKAAVIASGIVPPGIEGSGKSLQKLLARVCGPNRGIELVSSVNNIPKGSRLAVSTNLLAALIGTSMRATGQTRSLTGPLEEDERRIVLARALLGEWLGGSGGGWQDSGGVWPGMKLITGMMAGESDPEHGISRGRLMPQHRILDESDCSAATRQKLQDSLVLVHGGMAQNVGPILEMVTEKYLLRSEAEWKARQNALGVLDEILAALKTGDVRKVGELTTRNFREPIQTIIPWASNYFTEHLIEQAEKEFGEDFWGFWMLGGMSGGGMGFIFAPERKAEAQQRMQAIMTQAKRDLEHSLPFAMEPVVYDFAINEHGTAAELLDGPNGLMPPDYYTARVPALLRKPPQELPANERSELDKFGTACRLNPELSGMVQTLFNVMLPKGGSNGDSEASLNGLLNQFGFDREQHERIRRDLRDGAIGLSQNRLRADSSIEDVSDDDFTDARPFVNSASESERRKTGMDALARGELAVISLAAGAGSRWTQGAGVVKALNPFARLGGRHRTFIETHLAKSRRMSGLAGNEIPHIFTTSYLTHGPISDALDLHQNYGYAGPVLLSPGKSIGQRMVPMERDLRFAWEELPQQVLDEQQQKVRDSLRTALIGWAATAGEATDYTDNLPLQCLHPVGHWYEVPNLLLNGTLAGLLKDRPQLNHLLLHNIDTLGADANPDLLGLHIESGNCLSFEVITRRLEDRGGGLARINGRPRLVEGLAMPREEDEFKLSYYNTMTTWISIDPLLKAFGLTREDLSNATKVANAVRDLAARMPTYITLKDVKKRWGHGQEDVFPVTQFEKLWSDLTALPEIPTSYFLVPRLRGQQLKDPAQLDGWLRDGSASYLENLCKW
jgi:galactokinase/mevalonate kinase-like predicted kinase